MPGYDSQLSENYEINSAVHQRLFSVLEIFHTASVESSLNWAGRPSGEPET
jgi:hypothetical protein